MFAAHTINKLSFISDGSFILLVVSVPSGSRFGPGSGTGRCDRLRTGPSGTPSQVWSSVPRQIAFKAQIKQSVSIKIKWLMLFKAVQ